MTTRLTEGTVVAVIGAGTMGAGIAQLAAAHGHRVQLHDARFGAADTAKAAIAAGCARRVAAGRISAEAARAIVERITTMVTLPDACVAALVIEAIVESLADKRELLRRLADFVAPECILASNTSSLSITALAAGLAHPGRVVGMHFFNPVAAMPLVEVVAGLATAPAVADTVAATALAWGKMPVRAASTPGFIVNRCARPYYAEAFRLVGERATDPATLDAVLRECGGFRMGPFELMDLIGHDINLAVTRNVWDGYFHDPRFAPSVLQQELVAAGFLGRKSGRGVYDYAPGAVRPAPATDPARARPATLTLHGDPGIVQPLALRVVAGGVALAPGIGNSPFGPRSFAVRAGAVGVSLADGRTATARGAAAGIDDLVLFDLALDYPSAARIAVARGDRCGDDAYALAVGALQAAGLAVSRVDDVAGLLVMRTVAMLANEAADAVVQGVADPPAVDTALQQGVSYPRGPLAWADAVGVGVIRDVLVHLALHYGEDRYRVSPLIARRALTGGTLNG
jgi:3-hydroxybutyryl-CoA dehydrogenase